MRGWLRVGLFVSTYGFTPDAIREARSGAVHIELMDLEGLLARWTAFYEKMSEADKAHLRLRQVYFLAPD